MRLLYRYIKKFSLDFLYVEVIVLWEIEILKKMFMY